MVFFLNSWLTTILLGLQWLKLEQLPELSFASSGIYCDNFQLITCDLHCVNANGMLMLCNSYHLGCKTFLAQKHKQCQVVLVSFLAIHKTSWNEIYTNRLQKPLITVHRLRYMWIHTCINRKGAPLVQHGEDFSSLCNVMSHTRCPAHCRPQMTSYKAATKLLFLLIFYSYLIFESLGKNVSSRQVLLWIIYRHSVI